MLGGLTRGRTEADGIVETVEIGWVGLGEVMHLQCDCASAETSESLWTAYGDLCFNEDGLSACCVRVPPVGFKFRPACQH